jgi:phage baseplate assembly protein W
VVKNLDKFYTPSLPLTRGKSFDYEYIRNLEGLVKQNLKNILLTIPGERVMDPDFGVGVYKYLFESFGTFEANLEGSIYKQVSRYAPFVRLLAVDISNESDHVLRVTIKYEIPSLSVDDELSIGTKKDTSTGGPKFLV